MRPLQSVSNLQKVKGWREKRDAHNYRDQVRRLVKETRFAWARRIVSALDSGTLTDALFDSLVLELCENGTKVPREPAKLSYVSRCWNTTFARKMIGVPPGRLMDWVKGLCANPTWNDQEVLRELVEMGSGIGTHKCLDEEKWAMVYRSSCPVGRRHPGTASCLQDPSSIHCLVACATERIRY
eukprot:Hpha_TRINITY_DN28326_c0_g1::TRINITY_DN28326_c0_g1_i1::g.2261::m.2261